MTRKMEELRNMKEALRHIAILARGMVLTGEVTKEEMFCFIMETGNEEFEKAFAMSEEECVFAMIADIVNSGLFEAAMEELEREEK